MADSSKIESFVKAAFEAHWRRSAEDVDSITGVADATLKTRSAKAADIWNPRNWWTPMPMERATVAAPVERAKPVADPFPRRIGRIDKILKY